MPCRKLFLLLAIAAVLVLQVADCASAMTPDQQSMQCCGSMPCSPANKTQGCCKTMISAPAPSVIVKARVTVSAPHLVTAPHAAVTEYVRYTSLLPGSIELQQDSSQELYTLHSALLI